MLRMKNNFIMPPIKLGYSDGSGKVNERHIAFYRRRCRYLGAVIPEPLYIDKGLREIPTQMGIDSDDKVEGLHALVSSMHESGSKVIAHLNHPGRMANPLIPGNYFVSSTDRPCENGGAIPKRMNAGDMNQVIDLFKNAAIRAEKAGFDAIELQFGHGYLLAQFVSPLVNDRTDEYGGDFKNMIRFPLEVLDSIRKSVDLPLIARVSGDEMIPGSITMSDMVEFSSLLEKHGVCAIHVSAGTVCSTPPWYFQHMFVPKGKTWEMAAAIKKDLHIPVIFVGQINTSEDIERLRAEFPNDYIAVGRALIADPDFIGKYLGEVQGAARPCLACAEGCLGGVKSGQGLSCLVNPRAGKETEIIEPAKTPRRYAVVGGGLAGMEAAIILKQKGHEVDLYEKEDLGGQFNLAPLTPNKKSLHRLVPYLVQKLKDEGITVLFKEAVPSDLMKYDEAILATGSKPAVPEIPGLDTYFWADILREENLPENKNVLIIGGGLIGVDIATGLIPRNNRITIVKRTTDFGEDMEMIAKKLSLKMMKEKGTVFSDHTYIRKIDGKTVYAERNGENIQFRDIDIIVVSTGMRSFNPLEETLKDIMPAYVIGDAKKIGNAQDAIRDACETVIDL
ncbi:MAG: FAD-dependent oxidoreductase [Deltaproteobacteria bacterium]|nr:FAD-dependent oxidoreductase [Deltaproteobacteria bacterium]